MTNLGQYRGKRNEKLSRLSGQRVVGALHSIFSQQCSNAMRKSFDLACGHACAMPTITCWNDARQSERRLIVCRSMARVKARLTLSAAQVGKTAIGGIKPPKLKTEDEEHTYIQRPVGEQFRPPPPPATHQRPG